MKNTWLELSRVSRNLGAGEVNIGSGNVRAVVHAFLLNLIRNCDTRACHGVHLHQRVGESRTELGNLNHIVAPALTSCDDPLEALISLGSLGRESEGVSGQVLIPEFSVVGDRCDLLPGRIILARIAVGGRAIEFP